MSLIKKIDVEKHFAARRAMRLGRTGPASQPGAARIKSAARRNVIPVSADDVALVHSFPSVPSPRTSDYIRLWTEPVAQTTVKPATLKLHTVFLRNGCVLPERFDLRHEPFSKGWAEAKDTAAMDLDAAIRGVGWHFMWLADSYSSQALGRTAETAIHRALARTLPDVRGRFNAAELDSVHVTSFAGFHIARVTVQARQIQSQASLN